MTFGDWETLEKIGEGGQGDVYQVVKASALSTRNDQVTQLRAALARFRGITADPIEAATAILDATAKHNRPFATKDIAAATKYKIPAGPEGSQPRKRLFKEVEALKALADNPAILRLLASDVDAEWIVTEYYPEILNRAPERYKGRPLEALQALRPVVAAVAEIHERAMVHRDIKTPNIFIAADGRLVLGDFGIVFYEDPEQKTRVTESFEKVGTRDWMAPWTHTGRRLDAVPPSFDVFGLGKVLWSMVSGSPTPLPYWYWRKAPYNLEALFLDSPDMRFINRILARTVCEEESDCLPDAKEMLALMDDCIVALSNGGQRLRGDLPKACRICGLGHYNEPWPSESVRVLLVPTGAELDKTQQLAELMDRRNRMTVRLFKCNMCGHIELFHFQDGAVPTMWRESDEIARREAPMPGPWHRAISEVHGAAEVSRDAWELLREASKDKSGTVLRLRTMGGLSVQTNNRNFVNERSARTEARWEAALRELIAEGLVQDRGHKNEVFGVTHKGFAAAERL